MYNFSFFKAFTVVNINHNIRLSWFNTFFANKESFPNLELIIQINKRERPNKVSGIVSSLLAYQVFEFFF